MDKIRIRQNYENYERVQKAFRDFIHALVWESMDIDSGVHEDEINEHIERYCRNNGDQMISLTNDSVTKFIKSLESRYEVHLYECDEVGNIIEETAKHIDTDNLKLALQKGAEFYRYHSDKHPTVNIFDNEIGQYIAEWD
jgi:hypothetical protein